MKIAELFVNLGITGGDKAGKSLEKVKDGMKGIVGSSLEAKAAIAAVIYGLNRLTGAAGLHGTELTRFTNLTGLSAMELQRWQLAAEQSGGSAEEMASAFKQVQAQVAQMRMGLGAPGGFAMLAEAGIDEKRLDDTFYMMQKLREFAISNKSHTAQYNEVLKTFLGEGTIASFRSRNFSPEKVTNSQILNDEQIKKLNKVNAEWIKFWNTLKMIGEKNVAKFGVDLAIALGNVATLIIQVNEFLDKLVKKIPGLQTAMVAAGVAIGLAWAPITTIVTGLIFLFSEMEKHISGKESIFSEGGPLDRFAKFVGMGPSIENENLPSKASQKATEGMGWKDFLNPKNLFKGFGEEDVVPNMKPVISGPTANNTTVNQRVNIVGVEGAEDAVSEFKGIVNQAFRQMNQGQVA